MLIINAENAVLGRVASSVAKKILSGEEVSVINVEKAVMSGGPKFLKKEFAHRRNIGDTMHGPYFPRYPDRFFSRVVRGMLPWNRNRGREALQRLRVYVGRPAGLEGKEEKPGKTVYDLRCKFITVKDVCRAMGAKVD